MTWNNVYLSTTPGTNFKGSGDTVPLTTSGVSIIGSLGVGSELSVRGTTSFHSGIESPSNFSMGALSATSGTFSGRVSIGAGTPIVFISASSSSLVATTATATKSTTTNLTNNLAAVGDIVTWGLGTSTSSLSAGLTLSMYVSAASTIQIRLSNCSTVDAAQHAISLTYAIHRLSW